MKVILATLCRRAVKEIALHCKWTSFFIHKFVPCRWFNQIGAIKPTNVFAASAVDLHGRCKYRILCGETGGTGRFI